LQSAQINAIALIDALRHGDQLLFWSDVKRAEQPAQISGLHL